VWDVAEGPRTELSVAAGARGSRFLELKNAGGHQGSVQTPKPAGARECTCTYLDRPRPRKQKGGTVLARHVRSVEEHEATLRDPDKVRHERCLSCKIGQLYVHDRRSRIYAGEVLESGEAHTTEVLVFRCDRREECGAIWRVLPHFLARHLWRRWTLVGTVLSEPGPRRHVVPRRTQQRWRRRLRCAAAVLVALLGDAPTAEWVDVAVAASADASRARLLAAAGGPGRLADLAAIVDHLEPGVRIM